WMVFPHSGQRLSRRDSRIGAGRGAPPFTSRLLRCVNLVAIGVLGLRMVSRTHAPSILQRVRPHDAISELFPTSEKRTLTSIGSFRLVARRTNCGSDILV